MIGDDNYNDNLFLSEDNKIFLNGFIMLNFSFNRNDIDEENESGEDNNNDLLLKFYTDDSDKC